jgi:AraC-like DNA-binding protein
MSIKETARAVGYANQSHFAKRFKEKYGVLPKDYIKNIRAKIYD